MEKDFNILAMGESLIELSSEGKFSDTETFDKYYGGAALSSAVTASRFGSNVAFLTLIGNDCFKDYLLNELEKENLDISHIKVIQGINGNYFIAKNSDLKNELICYKRKSAGCEFSVSDIDKEYFSRAKVFYTTGIIQSVSLSAKEAVLHAYKTAKESGILNAYAPIYNNIFWSKETAIDAFDEICDYLDIVFLNMQKDVTTLFNIDSPENIIKKHWDRGVKTVVVNDSVAGGYYLGSDGKITFHNYHNSNTNSISDDVFIGGFLHAISNDFSASDSLKFASIAAGLQSQKNSIIKSIPDKEMVYNEFNK